MSGDKNFMRLVARMRDAQRIYNSNMTRSNLEAANDLELAVDRALLNLIDEQKKVDQLMLELDQTRKTNEEKGTYTARI